MRVKRCHAWRVEELGIDRGCERGRTATAGSHFLTFSTELEFAPRPMCLHLCDVGGPSVMSCVGFVVMVARVWCGACMPLALGW